MNKFKIGDWIVLVSRGCSINLDSSKYKIGEVYQLYKSSLTNYEYNFSLCENPNINQIGAHENDIYFRLALPNEIPGYNNTNDYLIY